MPDEGKIINAVDNDDGGDLVATKLLNDILARIPGPARALTDDRPLDRGWTGMTSRYPARSKSIDLEELRRCFLRPPAFCFFLPAPTPRVCGPLGSLEEGMQTWRWKRIPFPVSCQQLL